MALHRCKADVLRDMLCGHAEAPYAQEIDNLLDLAHTHPLILRPHAAAASRGGWF